MNLSSLGETLGRLIESIPENESAKGLRSRHFWTIVACFLVLTAMYYIEQTALIGRSYPGDGLLTGVHDLHRILFLIPIMHAALVYRVHGSLVASAAFFCVVLPRALYISPYPHPMLRALLSVASTTIIGILTALWLNRFEKGRKARADLAAAYRALQESDRQLKENQEMLIHAEKLASMGQLAASIAHEVNNPLSGVLVYMHLMMKKIARGEVSKEQLLDYLSKMEFEITRSAKLIRNLLDFSSQSEPKMEEVDVTEVLNKALDLTVHSGASNTRVERDLHPVPKVVADPEQLQEVFINLIMNAFQAMPEGGTLLLSIHAVDREVRIAVNDTGCGIPPENMGKLFTPFFSTKKEVKGVGLGLSVAYGIIQQFNGRIEVQSTVGKGSAFTVCLPALQSSPA
jgi:signal transduction histidine kinase